MIVDEEITAMATAIASETNSRIHVYSGPIDDGGYGRLIESMQPSEEQPFRDNVILILTTNGGLAGSAYKIARTLQRTSTEFSLYVPSYCKSAGTLIALGASRLVMTGPSELGPLDVQLVQEDEIGRRRSGLTVRTAFEGLAQECYEVFEKVLLKIKSGSGGSITYEMAAKTASSVAVGVMAPVYAQISPENLGRDLRDLHVATAYGQRLVSHGGNADFDTVGMLVSGYPSHDFIIDSTEASALFEKVERPSDDLLELVRALGRVVYAEQQPHFIERLDRTPKKETGDGGKTREARDQDPGVAGRRQGKRQSNSGGEQAKPTRSRTSPQGAKTDS
ncbi:MAG: hypothetical protein AAGG65_17665 [Pseudomonadota bacterium]